MSAAGSRSRIALLEVYDAAIEELSVLEDPRLLGLILRLERRRREAVAHLAAHDAQELPDVAPWVRREIESARGLPPPATHT